jgi:hypothetical protein
MGSIPEVHFFPTTTREHTQGLQVVCILSAKRQGCGKRIRKSSGSARVSGRDS